MSLLSSIHAGQLVANKTGLVTATLSDTVENVLGKLLVHNIISLPLLNEVRLIFMAIVKALRAAIHSDRQAFLIFQSVPLSALTAAIVLPIEYI